MDENLGLGTAIAGWAPLVLAIAVGIFGIIMRTADNADLRNRREPYYAAASSLSLCAAFTFTHADRDSAAMLTAVLLAVTGVLLMGAALKLRRDVIRRLSTATTAGTAEDEVRCAKTHRAGR